MQNLKVPNQQKKSSEKLPSKENGKLPIEGK